MVKLRQKTIKTRPAPVEPKDRVRKVLQAQTDALAQHEASIAKHTRLQTYVAIITTVVLATITFFQYRAGERQVRLEYAKTANQYDVTMSYRDRDGSVVAHPWIVRHSAMPYELTITKTAGISTITRVEVFQKFRLMAEAAEIQVTGERGCVVGTTYMFLQEKPGSLEMSLPGHLNDSFQKTSFTMPDGRVGKISAEETTIVIQFRDIFGKERSDVISGFTGSWAISQGKGGIYSNFDLNAIVHPGEIPKYLASQPPSKECAPWMIAYED